MSLSVNKDDSRETIEIEGIKYSYDLFRQLGGLMPVGELFELAKREDGAITVLKMAHFKEVHI